MSFGESSCFELPALPLNGHSPTDYAPRSHPGRQERMRQSTIIAVDQIGVDTARQIGEARKALRRAWEETDAKIQRFEEAMQEHARAAHEEIVSLVTTFAVVGDSVVNLSAKLKKDTRQ